MGAGKSTVAKALGARLVTGTIDLDEEVARLAGKSIAQVFADQGEPAFRALEKQAIAGLGPDTGVVALGGGAVVDAETRYAILGSDILVTLTAGLETLASRVGAGSGRPLLGERPASNLARILEARAPVYAEAHAVINTEGRAVEQIAAEVLEVAERAPIVVPLGVRTYCVDVGQGVRHEVGALASLHAPGAAVLVYDGDETRPWPGQARHDLAAHDKTPIEVRLEGREASKNVASVEQIWDTALEAGVDRQAILIGVGGGVIGDLTAFAASTLLRGVALGQIPTTLLAMVDSSVGGKTGFNRARGKNLVGTFYQPKFVLCDVDTLSTLPKAERISGLAEVVKSAWLDSEDSVAMLERDADALLAGDPAATIRAVRMSVALKSRIVREDEHESGRRMLLNLGHTVCHALEAASHYQGLRHGEGVALGMIAAMRVAARLADGRAEDTERLTALLGRLGLPTDLDARLDEQVLHFIGSDKKRRGDRIHFIIPHLPGKTGIELLDIASVRRALGPE